MKGEERRVKGWGKNKNIPSSKPLNTSKMTTGICLNPEDADSNNKILPVFFFFSSLISYKESESESWSLSRVWHFVIAWTAACQALCPWNSLGKKTSGSPIPSLGDLPDPGIEPRSPALQADSLPLEPSGKPIRRWQLILQDWSQGHIRLQGDQEIAKHIVSFD